MKHANPSTIDPKEDDTSSMLTPNCSDRSTKPGLTKGPSAPSRDAPNVLDNNSLDKGRFVDKTTYNVQKHASFFQRGQFNLC